MKDTILKMQLVYRVERAKITCITKRLGMYGIPHWTKKTKEEDALVIVPIGDNNFREFQVMVDRFVRG